MLFVQIKAHGSACHAQAEYPGNDEVRATDAANGYHYETRNDWKTFERAQAVAQQLTDAAEGYADSPRYIATDAGPSCWPQFDVIRAPQVGDEVSYGFNGDYYPCGKVSKVSKDLRIITTDTGERFYRRRATGAWLRTGGTFALCHGHINERNLSF